MAGKIARNILDDLRVVRQNKGSINKLADDLFDTRQTPNKTITINNRIYRVGKSADDVTLTDPNGNVITITQVLDDIYAPPITATKTGGLAVSSFDDIARKTRTKYIDSGFPAKQADEIAKMDVQRIKDMPGVQQARRLEQANITVAQAPKPAAGQALSREAQEGLVRQLDDIVPSSNVTRQTVETAVRNSDPTLVRNVANDINTNVLDGALDKTIASTLRKADLPPPTAKNSLTVDEAKRAADEVKAVIQGAKEGIQVSLRLLGLYVVAIPIIIGATGGFSSATRLGSGDETVAAAVDTLLPDQAEMERRLYDWMGLSFAAAAREHQKDLNGCFVYNKITGSLTKVKLLTCGHFDIGTVMDTCGTQNYVTGNDIYIAKCAATTFNPCLKSSTSRTSVTTTPLVPNVCSQYLYKTNAPTTLPGVTATDACANVPADQPCSTYCSSDRFNLPDSLQLICVNVDFPTAYADLMNLLGYNVEELFSVLPESNASASSSKWKTAMIVTGSLVGVGILAYVVFAMWKIFSVKTK